MTAQKKEKVWDLAVRIFHWSLVATLFALYFVLSEESRKHIQAGYIVLGLVTFRTIWGFIGSKHARFVDFVRSPATVISYVRSLLAVKSIRYMGHNPLGGMMVIALLLSVFFTAWSGVELTSSGERGEHYWERIHETFAELTINLIYLHILGGILMSILYRENLMKAMVTGFKSKHEE